MAVLPLLACAGLIWTLAAGAGRAAAGPEMPAVPADCPVIATAHKSGCAVTNVLDCADGFWSVTYARDDLQFIHRFSRDWGLLDYWYSSAGNVWLSHVPDSPAQMSLALLAEKGEIPVAGLFSLTTGVIDGRIYEVSGEAMLTGETVTLGGAEFRKGVVHELYEASPGQGGVEFYTDILVDAGRNLMLQSSWSRNAFGAGTERADHEVRDVRFAGDPGFGATSSDFGCN